MTKTELRDRYIAARRRHAAMIRELDAAWTAAMGRITSAPRWQRPGVVERVAQEMAPLLTIPEETAADRTNAPLTGAGPHEHVRAGPWVSRNRRKGLLSGICAPDPSR